MTSGSGHSNMLTDKTGSDLWRLVRKGVAPAFNPQNIRSVSCAAGSSALSDAHVLSIFSFELKSIPQTSRVICAGKASPMCSKQSTSSWQRSRRGVQRKLWTWMTLHRGFQWR